LSVGTVGNGGVAGNLGQATNAAANLVLGGGTLQYIGATASTDRAYTLTASTTSTIDITNSGSTLTMSGSGANTSGALSKTGSGTLVFSGANSYTGLTTITAGTLRYGVTNALSTGPVTVNGGVWDVVSFNDAVGVVTLIDGSINGTTGVITGTSYAVQKGSISAIFAGTGIALTKSDTGTVVLSGLSTYTGSTTVTGGVLKYGVSNALAGGAVTVNGGTFDISVYSDVVGAVTLTDGLITGTSGTLTGTSYAVQNGTVEAILAGAVALTKSGTGTVTLSGTNTYTGVTTLSAGVLSVGTIGNGGTAGNLGAATNAAANLVLSGGTLRYTGTTASTDRNYILTAATVSTIDIVQSGATLTISGASTNTTGGLTKVGNGTLKLSGLNLFTGLTTVTAGTLAYGANNALSTGALTVSGGTLDMASFSETLGAVTLTDGSMTGTTGVLTGSSYTLQNGIVSAILGGTGAVTKSGSGTVTLSAVNTYSGTTTVSGGILQLGVSGAISNASNIVLSGGTLRTGSSTGNSETAGTLDLATSNSTIALGTGTHTLSFSASNAVAWDAGLTLTIAGWTGDFSTGAATGGRVYFGSNASGITSSQLLQIQFSDGANLYMAKINSSGEVLPDLAPPSSLSYSTPNSFSRGSIITPLTPSVTGTVTGYSISPALPSGLSINATTGVISGTPSVILSATTYTVTASNINGSTTATLSIAVTGSATTIINLASGNWSESSTWSPAYVPSVLDSVLIKVGTTVTVDIGNAVCGALTIANAGGLANLNFSNTNPSLTVSRTVDVGMNTANNNRAGIITFKNDASLVANQIRLNKQTNGSNSGINMTAGGYLTTGSFIIGTSATGSSFDWVPGTGTVELTSTNTLPAFFLTTFNNLIVSAGTTSTGVALTSVNSLTVETASVLSLGHAVTANSISLEGGCLVTGASISGAGILTLGGNVSVTDNGAGSAGATISCPIALTNSTTRTFTVADDGTSAADLSVSGVISTSGNIVKSGAGTMILSGLNTYTGTTQVDQGALRAVNNTVAVSTTGPFGNNAAGLTLNGGTIESAVSTFSRPVSVAANGSRMDAFGSARTISSTISATGTYSLTIGGVNSSAAEGQDLTLSGVISNGTGGTLSIKKDFSSKLTLLASNTFTGGTTLTAGTLNINTASALGSTSGTFTISGGTLDNTSGASLTTGNYPIALNGDFTFTGTNSLNLGTGAVTLGSNRSVTVTAGTLTLGGTLNNGSLNLSKAGSGTLSFGANNVTLNNLTISAGALTSTSGTLNLGGTFSNSGTFTASGGTVNFNGTSAQSISGSSATTFNNLTLNNSSGLSLSGVDATVNGTLTLTAGKITTGSQRVILGASASLSGAGSGTYVFGNLRRYVPNTSAPSSVFAVGDATLYAPVTIAFSGTTSGSGYLDVSTGTLSGPPAIASGLSQTKYLNRKWTVSNTGITGFTSYGGTFTFVAGDVLGSANTAAFVVRKLDGSSWSATTTGSLTSTSSQATGMTSFSDFYAGETTGAPTVSTQPSNSTICTGSNTDFTSASASSPTPTVKWQRSTNGTAWADITAGLDAATTYSNFTNGTVNLTGSTTALNGYQYRAVFSNINGSVNSDAATLTVAGLPTTAAAGADQAQCDHGQFVLAGNSPTSGSGTWTVASGTATIWDATSSTSRVSGVGVGASATLVWTVTNAPCAASNDSVKLTVRTGPTASASATTVSCYGDSSSVTVTATGGSSPYTGTGTFKSPAGGYSYTVTDNYGCTGTVSGNVSQPGPITVSGTSATPSCNLNSPAVSVVVTGGTEPYTYSTVFDNSGDCTVTITDTNGCQKSATIPH
jgi:autotransporter-associated beta strand protein